MDERTFLTSILALFIVGMSVIKICNTLKSIYQFKYTSNSIKNIVENLDEEGNIVITKNSEEQKI